MDGGSFIGFKKSKNYIKMIKKRVFSRLSEKMFVLLHAYCYLALVAKHKTRQR